MKKLLPFLLLLTADFCSYAGDSLSVQRFSITGKKGTIDLWIKDQARWDSLSALTSVDAGKTLFTRNNSEIQLTFEPAIFTTLRQNSTLSIDKLIVDKQKKTIRMLMRLEKGDFEVKSPSRSGYTLLFTLSTPSAVIYINNADISLHVEKDISTLQVLRGEAKVEHCDSQVKSMIYSDCKAVVYPDKPLVQISPIKETAAEKHAPKALGPTIAILSIQAKNMAKENLDRVSDLVAEEYQQRSNAKVLYLDDIRSMLKTENVSNLLDCFSDSCISKIGSSLGVDIVILGNIGQLGQTYLFSLKMVDVLRDKVLKRVTTSVDGNAGLILKDIPDMIDGLVATQDSIGEKIETRVPVDTSGDGSAYRETITWLKGGTFIMGLANSSENFDAVPKHKVTLKDFYIDKYEVTKSEFEKVMGYNSSTFRGCPNCPVDNVSWSEADQYCRKIGKRLPTEAEWEYACRAGTETEFSFGNTISSDQANFDGRNPYGGIPAGQFLNKPTPVGEYEPNKWGLYDMHGNLAEWCSDWYDGAYYGNSPAVNPTGPSKGQLRVVRGGSWNGSGGSLRSGKRAAYNPTLKLNNIGFRCVKESDSTVTNNK